MSFDILQPLFYGSMMYLLDINIKIILNKFSLTGDERPLAKSLCSFIIFTG